jgi:hypothetical protein
MVKKVTVVLRKEMFSGLLCSIDKLTTMSVHAVMTWDQIQVCTRIDGRKLIKKVAV